MKISIKVVWWTVAVLVVAAIFSRLLDKLAQLQCQANETNENLARTRDEVRAMRAEQRDVLRSAVAKQVSDVKEMVAPKGLMGFAQLTPEQLPPAL